jgi:hypothetical protein
MIFRKIYLLRVIFANVRYGADEIGSIELEVSRGDCQKK